MARCRCAGVKRGVGKAGFAGTVEAALAWARRAARLPRVARLHARAAVVGVVGLVVFVHAVAFQAVFYPAAVFAGEKPAFGVAGAVFDSFQPEIAPLEIDVALPQIDVYAIGRRHGFRIDLEGAEAVNKVLRERALGLIGELLWFGNLSGGYRVHVETPGLISVTMEYSGFQMPMAHPMHLRASVTANPATGQVYELADLFVDEQYVEVLSDPVARCIAEQGLVPLVPFAGISPEQEFYLTEESLVLYYQLYELAPYAWGFPEFEIPLASLREIARPDGPIGLLLGLEGVDGDE